MLGFLKGQIIAKDPEGHHCVVLVGGVGYEVSVPTSLFTRLLAQEEASLWVHTHVREDALVLFGFATEAEKNFFRVLLGVSGLGPKTALSLIAEHGADRLAQLILSKEADEISSAPGVGKKLAQRLILELGAKVEKLTWVTEVQRVDAEIKGKATPSRRQLRDDLASALANLGYLPQQIKNALDKVMDRPEAEAQGFEANLRSALKELSSRPLASASQELSS